MAVVTVDLRSQLAHNHRARTPPKQRQFNRTQLKDEVCRRQVIHRYRYIAAQSDKKANALEVEVAREFPGVALKAAQTDVFQAEE